MLNNIHMVEPPSKEGRIPSKSHETSNSERCFSISLCFPFPFQSQSNPINEIQHQFFLLFKDRRERIHTHTHILYLHSISSDSTATGLIWHQTTAHILDIFFFQQTTKIDIHGESTTGLPSIITTINFFLFFSFTG